MLELTVVVVMRSTSWLEWPWLFASVTKTSTAYAVLRLVEEGKVAFTHPISGTCRIFQQHRTTASGAAAAGASSYIAGS